MTEAAEEGMSALDDEMSGRERSSDESSSSSYDDQFLDIPNHNPKKTIGPSLHNTMGANNLVQEPSQGSCGDIDDLISSEEGQIELEGQKISDIRRNMKQSLKG